MTLNLPNEMFDAEANAPLDGIRVLDLSRLVSGNMVTHVLADYGADVIKIERPGVGDDLRNWKTDGVSTHWKVYCRNKKSISLDLRKPLGKELLLKLVKTAEVLVENFKPGTLEKWGIGPEVLLEHNSKLVIVRISGWGQTGPWSHKPGFGSLVEAMSGFASMNGFDDRPPVLPPLALADMIAGLYGAFSVMVAVREVEQKKVQVRLLISHYLSLSCRCWDQLQQFILFQEQYQKGRGAYPKQPHHGTCMSAKTENS